MQLIRCTQKLLKELNQNPIDIEPEETIIGGWHANLLTIENQKCALIVNDSTLYTLFIPFLTKQEFQSFDMLFAQHLFKSLLNEDFSQNQIEAMLTEHQTISYTKTNNRSVLGTMNEQKFQAEGVFYDHGGIRNTPVYEVNRWLNRVILGAIDYECPLDMMKKKLKEI